MMRTTGTPGSGIPSGCSGRQLFNLQARNLKKWPIPSKLRKRARQMVVRNMHLSAQRSQFRTAIKAVRKLIVAGDKAAAQEAFKKAESVIDSMARKGVLHTNAAARHKSRLSASIKAMA